MEFKSRKYSRMKNIGQETKLTKERSNFKKVTYYIKDPALIKKLKLLGVEKERDLSSLVTEAIEDLIKKYE